MHYKGIVANTSHIYRDVQQEQSDFVIDCFVTSEMSRKLCPVNMRWNGKEHFVISNQELHEERRQLMEAAAVTNEKRRLLPHEM